MASHVAVFNGPFIDLILSGKKTIEGRFTKVKCLPFGRVATGDLVRMKQSGGLLRGEFTVRKVDSFSGLTREELKEVRSKYDNALCAEADVNYWPSRSNSVYATLIHIGDVKRYDTPLEFPKRDRRAWVLHGHQDASNPRLFDNGKDKKSENAQRERPNPLRHDCSNALHCFVRTPIRTPQGEPCCRFCGSNPVNWPLLHSRNLERRVEVLKELRKEFFRNEWFSYVPDPKERRYAIRKGRCGLRERAVRRIELSVGPAQPFRDGTQTPFSGNIVFAAQHAVAGCCRKCIAMWHGIPIGVQMSKSQIDYLSELVMDYIAVIMPKLDEVGRKV